MANYWQLWLGALFLKREAFEYQRDRRDSFAHGLLFIVLIGVVVAGAGIVGAALRYASGPNADAVKNTVLTHLQAMPFYTQSIQTDPRIESEFLSGYNRVWANLGGAFMGYPTTGAGVFLLLLGLLTVPLGWLLGWLIYGVLAHVIASRNNPEATLAHGLGTLALATAPQLLNVVSILPLAGVSSVALGVWTLVLNVFALRTAYRVSTGQAIWAALFPLLLLLILASFFLCLLLLLIVPIAATGGR